jgi:hypothetical protein
MLIGKVIGYVCFFERFVVGKMERRRGGMVFGRIRIEMGGGWLDMFI